MAKRMVGRRKKSSNQTGRVITLSGGVSAEEKEETDEIERILGAKDLYDVLGMEYTPHWDAQEEAVRQSYLDKSRVLNPSQNTDARLGQAASRLAEAYDTLCDDELRTKYNLANGFEQQLTYGGLLGAIARAFGVNAGPGGRGNMPPPNTGPRIPPEERRARIEEQQRELEERHEEQQRNIRQQEEQLARMRRQHQSGGLLAERSTAPPGEDSGQQQGGANSLQRSPFARLPPPPRGTGGQLRQTQRQGGASIPRSPAPGPRTVPQGRTRSSPRQRALNQDEYLDAVEARLREMMEAAFMPGGGGGRRRGEPRGPGQSRRQNEDYTAQLETLRNMGFTNEQQNLHALRQARGSVELAIEFLIET